MVTRLPNPRAVRGPARAPGGRDLHHPGPDAIREIHRIKRELRRAIWLMCEAPPAAVPEAARVLLRNRPKLYPQIQACGWVVSTTRHMR